MNKTVLIFLYGLFFCINIFAAPRPTNELKAIDYENLSKKEIKHQLGRKLKLKEKLALKIIKKRLKKERIKKAVFVETVDGRSINGYINKIQDDSVYISNYVIRWKPNVSSKYISGKSIVIPITQVNNIKIKRKNRVRKINKATKTGIIATLILSFIALIAGVSIKQDTNGNGSFQWSSVSAVFLIGGGLLGLIFALIAFLLANAAAKILTLELNGQITNGQMNILEQYFLS